MLSMESEYAGSSEEEDCGEWMGPEMKGNRNSRYFKGDWSVWKLNLMIDDLSFIQQI